MIDPKAPAFEPIYITEPAHTTIIDRNYLIDLVYPQDKRRLESDDATVAAILTEIREALASAKPTANPDNIAYNAATLELDRLGYQTMEMSYPWVVYVAGPMTGLPDFNYEAFCQARKFLLTVPAIEAVTIPHDIVESTCTHKQAMRITLNYMLNESDVMVVLPGAENSVGTQAELLLADAIGLPVLDYNDVREHPEKLTSLFILPDEE